MESIKVLSKAASKSCAHAHKYVYIYIYLWLDAHIHTDTELAYAYILIHTYVHCMMASPATILAVESAKCFYESGRIQSSARPPGVRPKPGIRSLQRMEAPYGSFQKSRVLLWVSLNMKALLFGVYTQVPAFWKLPSISPKVLGAGTRQLNGLYVKRPYLAHQCLHLALGFLLYKIMVSVRGVSAYVELGSCCVGVWGFC